MDKKYILAHDIGTTGNKATIYTANGEALGSTFYAYETEFPRVGWAEQNPDDWWKAVCETSKELLAKTKINPKEIACITFSGQMMGCVLVDKKGNPLRNAIIWADMRAEEEAQFLKDRLGMEKVYKITGHRISSSYSGAKLMWVKNHEPEIYKNAYKILHAKDFLVNKLTGVFATDYSDASGMNLFDIISKKWSSEIIEAWGVDPDKLPEAHPSTYVVGEITLKAAAETGLQVGTPVVIGGGDGCCAAVGVGVVSEGEAFNYIGSSSWIALATDQPIFDPEMKTYTWIHLDPSKYSPNGTMQAAGASYQWFRDQFYSNEKELAHQQGKSVYEKMNEDASMSVPGANKLIFLPYLLGERSPRWNPKARGAFIGLNIKHTRSDMVRAVLEGITMNLKVVLDTFRKEGIKVERMWVLGGGGKSKLWRQILADVYGVTILVPRLLDEATSMGAAIAGAVGVGLLKDFSQGKRWVQLVEEHHPDMKNHKFYNQLSDVFEEAYRQLVPIYEKFENINLN